MSGDGDIVDLFVIGGGVNGAGIARDAAGRGLSVILCEKDDLAEGTSSRSGKLVHGGLRYLEYYEFRLVREALIEREVLLESAPHIIWPMRFVLPHSPDDRPAWLVRIGLFLYDHLGGRKRLPPTRTLNLRTAPEGAPIKDAFRRGFEYSDCWVDDARLVVINALDAAERGAKVFTRTACTAARRDKGLWSVEMRDGRTGVRTAVRARALINAAGPWVNDVVNRVAGQNSKRNVRLVKGSHIVVPKFWEGRQAYLVQNNDKRVIFINPYQNDLTLIGTTDIPYEGRPEDVAAEESEIDYLIKVVNRYFKRGLTRGDVVYSFSGVRPLYDDNADNPSAVTRDYIFELDAPTGQAPLLSVFGGKITTFRKLAEHALDRIEPFFPKMGKAWTSGAHLPGGDIANADFEQFLGDLGRDYPWMPASLLKHYGRLYGTRTRSIVGNAGSLEQLGRRFGKDFFEREASYLFEHEWASTAADILDRRTKHGLHLSAAERGAFEDWCANRLAKAG
ncbi:glycerol-3-phosphate dehydrogenase [Mesorhizobium sp. M4B.F.Ca.ET.215.01.1.1]|uniref:glycerol-3-phosphate dehydrogenase n=1 Tax=unclassified Mesorhizobium TaxID=325217 RepID=UPI000FCC97E2|nr:MULTISPECIES: glycerol-3-phosphate dehydrogenase [unclassified Mesorhizobium]RUW18822.1 glycerol-3-phosphate dehydrogenase [Mesorhizobium sp. M4B.F.Ca.ET.013.02.1.1]RVD39148.1 glycerol-3-phosphate dehydrogenase [Mesorhizobium sp. M4B.F.Ca.ET.019.03.1.1]TGQ18702.1 glycerol-3-phosphate dehydrogenase [Mesorhizobium sp. M4B.F.Ca.ET.215.01.1.1]TGQ49042.1 glycerol-3-phosphate dehydrogenase [Mesorhizobium sp. M00.F.Ca.ET.220.01.1.1]TGR09613.1 glycerol-3-phosphate dehydrogenase [Mesorhizobium sp. M